MAAAFQAGTRLNRPLTGIRYRLCGVCSRHGVDDEKQTMLGRCKSIAVASLPCAMMMACAPVMHETEFRTPPRPPGLTCDTASAVVTTFGRSTARLYAETALKREISDLRGHMFRSGLRRIRLVQRTTNCASPYGGAVADLQQCQARAQMCGA